MIEQLYLVCYLKCERNFDDSPSPLRFLRAVSEFWTFCMYNSWLALKMKKKRSIIIERAVKWKLFLSPYLFLPISKNCVYHCILTLFRLFNTCNTRFYEKLIFDKRSRYMYFRKESIDPWYELNASETLNYWIEETFKFHGLMHEDNGILITNSTCSWTLSDASVFKVPVPWGLWNLEVSLNVHLA